MEEGKQKARGESWLTYCCRELNRRVSRIERKKDDVVTKMSIYTKKDVKDNIE